MRQTETSDADIPGSSNTRTYISSKEQSCLPSGLDSGDIVLFNRRCTSMSLTGAALCIVAKLFSNSQWDHVGVVVRHPATGELLFLEADFGGVKLRTLHERINHSKSIEIAVRKLSIIRTSSIREKLYAFAQEMVGRPYEIGTGSVLIRVSDPVAKQERERLNALLLDKEAQLCEISRELETAAVTVFQRKLLEGEHSRIHDQCQTIHGRLQKEFDAISSLENLRSNHQVPSNNRASQGDLSRVFCSELVAAAYQRVGLLGSYPPPFHYSPKDFSSQQTHPPGVHLLKGARLSNDMFVRKSTISLIRDVNDPTRRKQVEGVHEGDAPTRNSRVLIREALKRTPIYGQVPDEYKRSHLLKSFRARMLEPGDVVFEQGQYGDKIYVIDSGQMERFMQKGDEDPILVSTLGPRTTFGLTAFIFNSQRASTIRAMEHTLLWELDKPTFELFKDASSDIALIASTTERRTLRRLLQGHFLFNRLDKLGANEVDAFFHIRFRSGEEVFKQGDAGDNFYIIKSGEFERHICRPRASRNEDSRSGRFDDEQPSRVKTLHPGQSFGELSLMYNAPRSATVRARTDAECWAISTESYHRLNLGSGTPRLRAIFEKNASVQRDGDVYMTRADLMRFTDIDSFPEEDRQRLSALLVALVASNRAKDPMMAKCKQLRKVDDPEYSKYCNYDKDDEEDDILMDYWEFVRFDIMLNNPNAELDFAFRLTDRSNAGFISLHDVESMLQDYAEIDQGAQRILNLESSRLRRVFGKNGTRRLSLKEFKATSKEILPLTFQSDVTRIITHMLNVDVGKYPKSSPEGDIDQISFMEPDGAASMIGSLFIASFPKPNAENVGLQQFEGIMKRGPKRLSVIDWGHIVSIGIAGAISRTTVAPLERLKILMQTSGPSQFTKGWISGAQEMIQGESSAIRALFRGNGANVIRIVPAAVIQLIIVDMLQDTRIVRQMMQNTGASAGSHELVVSGGMRTRAIEAVLIGGVAGIVSATAIYPLDFIRGRLSIQRRGFEQYRGTFHGLREAARKEGIKSLYRGLVPTLVGGFPYVGLSFATYETLRPILPKRNDGTGIPTTGSSIICGIFASTISQIASFPLDTCRRRMQVAGFDPTGNATAKSFWGTWKEVGHQMGWRGYFRGMTPNLFKVVPASAFSFVAYEHVRSSIRNVENAMEGIISKSSPDVGSP